MASLAGVDSAAAAIQHSERTNPWATYLVGDGRALPFPEHRFDIAFASSVLQVLPERDRVALLAELRRVVRPGGLVVVFEHNPYNPLTRLVVRRCSFADDVTLLWPQQMLALLRAAGLDVVEHSYFLVFVSRRRRLRALEHSLRGLPLGAQYAVAARRSREPGVSSP